MFRILQMIVNVRGLVTGKCTFPAYKDYLFFNTGLNIWAQSKRVKLLITQLYYIVTERRYVCMYIFMT